MRAMSRDLNVAETFPPGTSVAAYRAEDWTMPSVESGEPPKNVSPAKSATVAASGVLSLDLGTGRYVATALVAGRRRYVRFSV